MGKQINYWLGYEDFLKIAQAALDCGCIIVRPAPEKVLYGQTLDLVTERESRYCFYVRSAGKLTGEGIPADRRKIGGYTAFGNTAIEAGFSIPNREKRVIPRSRLYVISGYYNDTGDYVPRPDHVTKLYNKLVRVVKKLAPYTELTDTYTGIESGDHLQEKEWKHKEYVSPQFLRLKLREGYTLR